ncbi:hypothetical protein ScPMuIL_006636 [Solemya velum]
MNYLIRRFREIEQWTKDVADPRVEDWPLMKDPVPTLTIFVLYVSIVKYGPGFMRDRKPMALKWLILPYNVALVGLSVYMFYEFFVTAYLANYSYKCQKVDYSDDPLAVRMASVMWWYFFSKIVELIDTVFFILRKKNNQVSLLHVYHHSSMLINWYLGVKYIAGGQTFFVAMINSFVHIIMYAYYALAALGPHMQPYLWWKRYLTRLQLIQFFAIVLHQGYNLVVDCEFSKAWNAYVFIYDLSLIVLFSHFYFTTYSKKNEKKSS